MNQAVIGVDPGGRETGLVLTRAQRLLAAVVIRRDTDGPVPDPGYLLEVLGVIGDWAVSEASAGNYAQVALETVTPPSGWAAHAPGAREHGEPEPINPAGLLAVGMVYGAVLAQYPLAVLVPPARHGKGPLAAYPRELIGPRERQGTGRLRHARSAWDVAMAAPSTARLAAAATVPPPGA